MMMIIIIIIIFVFVIAATIITTILNCEEKSHDIQDVLKRFTQFHPALLPLTVCDNYRGPTRLDQIESATHLVLSGRTKETKHQSVHLWGRRFKSYFQHARNLPKLVCLVSGGKPPQLGLTILHPVWKRNMTMEYPPCICDPFCRMCNCFTVFLWTFCMYLNISKFLTKQILGFGDIFRNMNLYSVLAMAGNTTNSGRYPSLADDSKS